MDEIEKRMRNTNPFSHIVLDQRVEERLAHPGGFTPERRTPSRRLPAFLAAAAILVLETVVAVATLINIHPGQVFAATPPALKTSPVEGSSADLLKELSMGLQGSNAPGFLVRFESWGLSVSVGEPLPAYVLPQEHAVEHRPDGSGSVLIQIGTPISVDGKPVTGVEVGETVWEQEFGPGEFPILYPEPPTDPRKVGEYLRTYGVLAAHPSTGDYLNSVRVLLSERRLAAGEHAALLQFLATLPDLEPMGAVVDRLGRDGIAFATETRTDNPVKDILIVSTEGLGILASEVTYLADDRPEIPVGAVIDYIAWK